MHLLITPVLACVNHVLASEAWASARLRPFAGQTVCLEFGAWSARVGITPVGLLEAEQSSEASDKATVTVRLPKTAPWQILIDRASLFANAHVIGSADLAETLSFVFRHLRWHAEDDLARFVGDITARRLALGGQRLIEWQMRSARNFARNLAEYLSEETSGVARRADVAHFCAEVNHLRDQCEQLDRRLARFTKIQTP